MNLINKLFRSLFWRLKLREQSMQLEQLNQKLDLLLSRSFEASSDTLHARRVIAPKGLPIAFISDKTYLEPTLVAIYSLCHSARPGTLYRVFLILSGCHESECSYVRHLFPGIEIIRHEACQLSYQQHDHVNGTTFEKFELPWLLPLDLEKVLYLDGDIIVRHDLTKLLEMDLGDNYARIAIETANFALHYAETLGMKHPENYFNAGVMLLNLNKMRKNNSCERLYALQAAHPDFRYYDQDCFNLHFEGQVALFPKRYNMSLGFDALLLNHLDEITQATQEDEATLRNSVRNPSIVHYAGKEKPWHNSYCESGFWWQYEYVLFCKMRDRIMVEPSC